MRILSLFALGLLSLTASAETMEDYLRKWYAEPTTSLTPVEACRRRGWPQEKCAAYPQVPNPTVYAACVNEGFDLSHCASLPTTLEAALRAEREAVSNSRRREEDAEAAFTERIDRARRVTPEDVAAGLEACRAAGHTGCEAAPLRGNLAAYRDCLRTNSAQDCSDFPAWGEEEEAYRERQGGNRYYNFEGSHAKIPEGYATCRAQGHSLPDCSSHPANGSIGVYVECLKAGNAPQTCSENWIPQYSDAGFTIAKSFRNPVENAPFYAYLYCLAAGHSHESCAQSPGLRLASAYGLCLDAGQSPETCAQSAEDYYDEYECMIDRQNRGYQYCPKDPAKPYRRE